MRIVMMGAGPFAVPTLRGLCNAGERPVCVVTRPARGRRGEPPLPTKAAAEELGLEVWAPESANLPESQQRLRELAADLLVVCDYGEILKDDTLATTRLGGINLHGSLLPRHRGAAPVQWAVLNGDAETGVTVIQMTPGLDAGPSLAQARVAIDPDETAGELEERLAELGVGLVLKVVEQLQAGATEPVPQDKSLATKAPRLAKADGAVDWSRPAREIKNQVRGLQPWPRTFSFWLPDGGAPVRLSIDRVRVLDEIPAEPGPPAAPGEVLEAAEGLVIATGAGSLEVLELQPAGKRRMTAAEFLRGTKVKPGDVLGPE